MKLSMIPALALCVLMLAACAESTDPNRAISAATNKIQVNIEGMTCTGCSGSVVAAVQQIDGVTACSADPATGDVVVALADAADTDAKLLEVETLLQQLEDGKYKVKSITVSYPSRSEPSEPPAAAQPAGEEQSNAESDDQTFVHTSYKVTGMDCSGCSSQIVEAVKQVDGVLNVEADPMTGAVSVAFEDRFDDKRKTDEIKDVIAGLSEGKYSVSY